MVFWEEGGDSRGLKCISAKNTEIVVLRTKFSESGCWFGSRDLCLKGKTQGSR